MTTEDATQGKAVIELPPEIAAKTYFDAIDAGSLSESQIERTCLADEDVAPFCEINSDATCDFITWIADVPCSKISTLSHPVFESYLYSLMPELNGWSGSRGGVKLEWFEDGARDTNLGELTSHLSPTTVSLVTGEITLDGLFAQLMTPQNKALISSLVNSRSFHHTGDNLLEAIMDGVPASLADGLL